MTGRLDLPYGFPGVLSLSVPQQHVNEGKFGTIFLYMLGLSSESDKRH